MYLKSGSAELAKTKIEYGQKKMKKQQQFLRLPGGSVKGKSSQNDQALSPMGVKETLT